MCPCKIAKHSSGRIFDPGTLFRGIQLPRYYLYGMGHRATARDVLVRERDFTFSRGAGAGYYLLCGTRLRCGHGISHLPRDYGGSIPNPTALNRGRNHAGEIPRSALRLPSPNFARLRREEPGEYKMLLSAGPVRTGKK